MHSEFSSLAFEPVRTERFRQFYLVFISYGVIKKDFDIVVIKLLSSNNCSDSPSEFLQS